MVRRIIVGAHYGLRDWLVQRVSAVVMALYTLLFVVILIAAPPRHYGAWKALFAAQPPEGGPGCAQAPLPPLRLCVAPATRGHLRGVRPPRRL